MKRGWWRVPFLLVCLVLIGTRPGLAAEVKAVTDRDRLTEGESFQLDLRVSGDADDEPDLALLEQRFEILQRSQSTQMQFVNGAFSRSMIITLSLLPKGLGELQIPAICFGSDCSLPLTVRVEPAGAEAAAGPQELLLEAEVGPAHVPVQGQVILTVRLLRRVDLLQAGLSEPAPEGVEAVVQRIGEDRQFEQMHDGYRYQVIERRYAIFPQQSGTLRIPPVQFDGQVPDGRRGRFDPFARTGRQVRKLSRPLAVEVTPVPADGAGRSWLPATRVELIDDWAQAVPQLTVGEPQTRTLTLRAAGVPAAQLPELRVGVPEEFRTYPDQPARTDRVAVDGIVGELQQKIAMVPTTAGRFRLPAISLDWWDVSARRWRTVTAPEVELEVDPGAGTGHPAPAGGVVPAEDVPPRPPVPGSQDAALAHSPSATGSPGIWPWLCLVFGAGWLGTLILLLWVRKRKGVAEEPDGEVEMMMRERQVRRTVLRAFDSGQPSEIRGALIDYGKCLLPDAGIHNLEDIAAVAGEPLAGVLPGLNAALYGHGARPCDLQSLREGFEAWSRQGRVPGKKAGLPDLYPMSIGK